MARACVVPVTSIHVFADPDAAIVIDPGAFVTVTPDPAVSVVVTGNLLVEPITSCPSSIALLTGEKASAPVPVLNAALDEVIEHRSDFNTAGEVIETGVAVPESNSDENRKLVPVPATVSVVTFCAEVSNLESKTDSIAAPEMLIGTDSPQ
jgi:hypothetical protein